MAKRAKPKRSRTKATSASQKPPSSQPVADPQAQPQAEPQPPQFLRGLDKDGRLDEGTLRRLVFRTFGRSRRTQDSPVMPDVWLRYIRVAERRLDRLPHPNQ